MTAIVSRIARSWRSRPAVVDLEQVERLGGDLGRDHAGAAHLGEVAHALEQPVGDARRAAGALGDRPLAVRLDLDLEDPGRAPHDLAPVVRLVVLEPLADAEAVAQRAW